MNPEQQLAFESRQRLPQAAFAAVGGVLLMVAAVIGLLGPHSAVDEQTLNLITEHKRAGYDIVATFLNAAAELSFGMTLLYLWRCARPRADRALTVIPVITILGVVLAAVTGIVYIFEFTHRAAEFVTTGQQTYGEATRLQSGTFFTLCKVVGQLAAFLIAISFVIAPLQAMKVGLLPRFMGYLGCFCGLLFLFPLVVVPIIQLGWLLAVALLVSGRWPDGVPAAWKTGRAEPWPSSAEMRARRATEAQQARERRAARKRGDHRAKVSDAVASPSAGESSADSADAAAGASPAAQSRKRKRKRKH